MWKTLIDIIFPKKCINCQKEGDFLCLKCFKKIPINKNSPIRFKNKKYKLDELIIVSYYQNPILKNVIYRYKYDFIQNLSSSLVSLIKIKAPFLKTNKNAILIPVPIHKKRLKWRNFNQSAILAQKLSQDLNLLILENLIIRKKYTIPQAKLKNTKERKNNLKNVFVTNKEIDKNLIKNKTVILIDDIYTTGATMQECAKIIKKQFRPRKIIGLVLAKG